MKKSLFARVTAYAMISLLVISFGVWGIADYLGYIGSQQPWLAKVNGLEIHREDVLSQYNETLQSAGVSGISPQQAKQINIIEIIINRIINDILLQDEAGKMGLSLNITAIKEHIQQDPQFINPDTKTFDPLIFNAYLQNTRQSEQAFVNSLQHYIQMLMVDRINQQIAPPQLSQKLYDWQFEQRSVKTVTIPLAPTNKIPQPNDNTLRTYYAENSDQFTTPTNRHIQLIHITPNSIASELEIPASEVQQRFLEEKERFFIPKQANAKRILFVSREEAQNAYDTFQNQQTKSFAALAEQINKPIEELGIIVQGNSIPIIENAIFVLEKTGVTPPVALPIGFALFFVDNIQQEQQLSLENQNVKDLITREIKIEKSFDVIYDRSVELTDALAADDNIVQAANSLNLQVINIPNLTADGTNAMSGETIQSLTHSMIGEVFNLSVGETSLVLEDGNNGYFVAKAVSETLEAVRPFNDIKGIVYTAWLFDTRMESAFNSLLEQSNVFINREVSEEEIEKFAKQQGATVVSSPFFSRNGQRVDPQTTSPLPPQSLMGDIFNTRKNYVLTSKSPTGSLLIWLESIKKPPIETDKRLAENEWNRTTLELSKNELQRNLRQKADIEYNNDAIQQVYEIL